MSECVPFLKVRSVDQTISWYKNLGFNIVSTNLIWEPDGELNWARIEWDGLAFMVGPDERKTIPDIKDSSLWFNVKSIDSIIELLESKNIPMEIEPATFYGRKVVSFKDPDGFQVSFSCQLV